MANPKPQDLVSDGSLSETGNSHAETLSSMVQSLGSLITRESDSPSIPIPLRLDDSYRSAESREFVKSHILPSSISSEDVVLALEHGEGPTNGDGEGEDDQENVDMDSYTLQVRSEIINWFAEAAERINDLIDEKEESSAGNTDKEAEYDVKIEDIVKENKQTFLKQVRPKVAEYMALIQESIRALQTEEEELLKYCSNMYSNTCQ